MQPLVFDDPLAGLLFFISAAAWGIGETVLAIRARPPGSADRSQLALFSTSVAGFALGVFVAERTERFGLPGGGWWSVAVGLGIFWAAIAFRIWAIHTLGRFFMCVVVIQEDHEVIDTGPYRLIRHPSYTGLIGAMLSIGIALDNWLALAIVVLPTLIGFSIRLITEERVLARELGEPYRDYMRRTHRLIPGVW